MFSKLHFMKVNCARHYDICRNKNLDMFPKILLHKPVIEKKDGNEEMAGFETYEFRKDLCADGIKAFFQVLILWKEYNEIGKLNTSKG